MTHSAENIREEKPQQPLENLMEQRAAKTRELQSLGVNVYPSGGSWRPTDFAAGVARSSSEIKTGEERTDVNVRIAGRLTLRRVMGKAAFADVTDSTGRIQIYVKFNVLGEAKYKIASELTDIGDIVGVEGHVFRTRTGEITVFAKDFALLSKSMRPLPEKWHGLKDPEARYRRRYLDLISNPEVREVFRKRARVVDAVRDGLKARGFLEVETPSMQALAGGAVAKPFITRHNALDTNLYLRIAPELFLKRLLVGGFDKVFEIGKSFRNEGIDRWHNPEFTMAEIYAAYSDYGDMMKLCEELVAASAAAVSDGKDFVCDGKNFAVNAPFARINFFDELAKRSGADFRKAVEEDRLLETARSAGVDAPGDMPAHKILDAAFDKYVVPHLAEPTFVCDFAARFSPLARPSDADPFLAERFELFIASQEVANAYSELNDPSLQKKNFSRQKSASDDETAPCDDDYVAALEHGMPPAGGLGIGIDRLVMLLSGAPSIREVILFPTLKPE
ncbi:MAG: lysine--tRNA ligase [Elusimicrobia bacterium HGW-Elusimicrobia-1]|jgi:lysyl-tRNA synthetase class 2|nr:MAG: lysine--tRNA ligase [Elusimicrobia bacterium HGW-Elusimicrobia-1]